MTPSRAETTTRTLLIAVIPLAALAATLPAAVVNVPASGALEAVPTAVDREDALAAVLLFCADAGGIFGDGFESGNWSAWSAVVGASR